MKTRLRQTDFNFLLIALLAASLVTLAWLQYRWVGQISEGERERLRKNASFAAENLRRDFDRQLTGAFLQMRVDSVRFESEKPEDPNRRDNKRAMTAPYPKIVRSVFVAEKDERSEIRLSVYDEATGKLKSAEWLPQLAHIRREIEKDLNAGKDADTENNRVPPLAPDTPALVAPITVVKLPGLKNQKEEMTRNELAPHAVNARRVGYTVALLDEDYIAKDLLPSLVARYFNNEVSQYDVTVASRAEPPQIVFQTDAQNESSLAGDVESDLLALRLNKLEEMLPAAPQPAKTNAPPGKNESRADGFSISVVTGEPPRDTTGETLKNSPAPDEQGKWRLIVRHRGSSLETAVENARRRNLFISFGILLLLAASGVLLVVLLNRERVLARRQSAFVASVSHELRTPLAIIRATSENIADGIVTDKRRVREYGSLINEEERRLSAMVEQMLEFAGAQTAQDNRYEFSYASVAEIIEAALNDYKAELDKNDFDVRLEMKPDLPEIFADGDALRRAFGNLFGNAVKYGKAATNEKQSSLEIAARVARNDKASNQIEIVIQDRGEGIEKKDLPQIFKLFYRGRRAVKAQIKGSGISLSMVKQIVEAHGGTISVASPTRQGSVFTIRPPAADESVKGEL